MSEWTNGIDTAVGGFRILGRSDTLIPFEEWEARCSGATGPTLSSPDSDAYPAAPASSRIPQVSVICSLYGGGKFIEPYLANITSQVGFENHELVIVDANSPDGEESVIRRYKKRFPNIVYHRLPTRIGIYEAWNIGIRMSRGEYLTNANLDDSRHPRSLDAMASFLHGNSDIDVVYSDTLYALEPHLPWQVIEQAGFSTDLPPLTSWNILEFNSPHCAPMWRRRLHDQLGYFDESFRSAGDWEFWVRCADHGKWFHKLDTPLIAYYLNPEGISTSRDSPGIREQWPIRERYRDMLLRTEVCLDPLRVSGAQEVPT